MSSLRWLRVSSRAFLATCIGLLYAAVCTIPGNAAPILNVTLTPQAVIASCTLHPGSGDETETGMGMPCTSTAYQPLLANVNSNFIVGNFDGRAPTNQTFGSTFTNWNVSQGANFGGTWAIINGGTLDVTFNVTDTAFAGATLGGINPFQVTVTTNPGYAGPPIGQLVWTQALYDSYSTQPPFNTDLNPPLNTLDTYSTSQGNPQGTPPNQPFINPCGAIPGQTPGPNNTTPATIGPTPAGMAYCDPIYPFQLAGATFSDGPQAFWPDESFRAIALLSTVTFRTDATGAITERDLTVYNGVSWAFDLAVPEPGTSLLIVSALALCAVLRRRMFAG